MDNSFFRVTKLNKFLDDRGVSMHDIFAKSTGDMHNEGKGLLHIQINYSTVNPGIIKAWHRHQHQDDYFCVLRGNAKVGIVGPDVHIGNRTLRPSIESYYTGEDNPSVIHIKAGEWHGLTPVGDKPCGLLYFVTNLYDPTNPDEERANFDEFVPKGWWEPKNG